MTRAARLRRRLAAVLGDESGASPVEFVLVGTLLTVLTLGVLQLGLVIYVRNVLHDAAVEGAYHAALADTSLPEGVRRTAEIVRRTVGAEALLMVAVLGLTSVLVNTIPARDASGLNGICTIAGHVSVAP